MKEGDRFGTYHMTRRGPELRGVYRFFIAGDGIH
jgi:hypothetical protein